MRIHEERFHHVFGMGRRDRNQQIGALGEDIIVDLCEDEGIHALRTAASNHPIDVTINEEFGAEVRVFLNYKTQQVRMHKKMLNRKRGFCERTRLKPLVIVIKASEEPYEYDVLYGPMMKGWTLENMSCFQEFLNELNGGEG